MLLRVDRLGAALCRPTLSTSHVTSAPFTEGHDDVGGLLVDSVVDFRPARRALLLSLLVTSILDSTVLPHPSIQR